MRRVLPLVLLAVPVLAAAELVPPNPARGEITYPTQALTAADGFINAEECQGGSITLKWSPAYDTSIGKSAANLAGGSYQLFASDRPDDTTVNSGICPKQDDDKGVTGLHAGAVSGLITTDVTDPSPNLVFDTAVIASVAGLGACTAASSDLILCVQARDSGGNPIGTARRRLTVATTGPAFPAGVTATSGDGAVNVSWTESSGSPAAESYQIDATPLGTTDPTPLHQSPRITGTRYRLGNLVNGTLYRIVVHAYSTADNPSADSGTAEAYAEPVSDFWDEYQGKELGGCTSGLAGPLGLAAVAGALALRRRRK